jgi:small-conductance mechanosensitive channel
VGDAVVFVLAASFGGKSAEVRARDATKALRDVVAEGRATPDEVRVETRDGVAVVYAGSVPVVQLGPLDAELSSDATLEVHADGVAASVRRTLRAEQKRSAVAETIFSVSLAVFFAVVTLFLLRKLREAARRADVWLEENPERVPAIRLRTIEVLHPAAVRSALALAVGVGRWVGQLGLVYAWLIAVLSLFEATRGLTEQMTGYLLSPLGSFTGRVATSLPVVVLVVIAGLALAILLRVVGLFFEGLAEGTTQVAWLPPDLARPTSALLRTGMVVLALVFVAPVITGDPDGALARSGLVALVALGIATVPLLATAAVGAGVVFGRRIRQGEWAEVGSRAGRIIDVSLFETILEDDEANEVRVPHLALLWHPTRLHGALPRVVVEVAVEPALASEETRLRLLDAAASVGADARVELVRLEMHEARFALAATTDDAEARSQLLLRANAELAAMRRAAAAGGGA